MSNKLIIKNSNKIKILSETTINRMAAGETIERPASAIKELIENSIDAGASDINLTIHNGGKNLIIVTDDGQGMNYDDLQMCVERHATSKLDEADLQEINFFGFRGEALPAIGAISRLTITSRKYDSDEAWSISINGGNKETIRPASLPSGTRIEVRDLFFATPARLKFLKNDKYEQTQIIETLYKLALAHPNINFSLQNEHKTLFSVKNTEKDFTLSRKKRVVDILGKEFIDNAIAVEAQKEDFSLTGYISLPTYNRSTSTDQFFYVNNRCVKDKILSTSIKIAYQDFLAPNRFPIITLFLTLPNHFLDVNVHPTKTEIRFKDPIIIRNFVISALKEAIRNIGHKAANTPIEIANKFKRPEIQPYSNSYSYTKPVPSQSSLSFTEKVKEPNFNQNSFFQSSLKNLQTLPEERSMKTSPPTPDEITSSSSSQNLPIHTLGIAKAQLQKLYIVSLTENSLILIDQHAAHERLLYEKLKKDYFNKTILKQRLLRPEIIELEYPFTKVFDYQSQIEMLGFTIEKFGSTNIQISEIPAALSSYNIKQLILDIIYDLEEYGSSKTNDELITHLLSTIACHYSIRAGRRMNEFEMQELISQMEFTPHSGQCNHGRPTYVEISVQDIEKLFKRT
jgi:DNA mismatch repair protein MutL